MATVADKLDIIEANIMSGLKDFQRATVCRIAELYKSGQMRVLVSDEVGLGKTLIARGTVAKLANIRKAEGDKLVKVVYICSNIAIADQNLNKLRISSEVRKENASYSRLSMQHLNIFNQENDTDLLNGFIQLLCDLRKFRNGIIAENCGTNFFFGQSLIRIRKCISQNQK